VDNDILVDARRTRTRKEPKRQSKDVVERKQKEKGKTRKKINFSQETLSPRWISKVLKSSRSRGYIPPPKRPRV
jgi:hypothetical protein